MKFTMNILLNVLAFKFYILTPGPAIIRTVCKYSRLIFITDKLFAFVRVSLEIPYSAAQDGEMLWEICHLICKLFVYK